MSLQLYRFYGVNSDKGFTKSFETDKEAIEFSKTLPSEVEYDPEFGVPNPPPAVFWYDDKNGDWFHWNDADGCWVYNFNLNHQLKQNWVPHCRPDGSLTNQIP
jgi:hypothetical protein